MSCDGSPGEIREGTGTVRPANRFVSRHSVQVADMVIKIEASRLLVWRAAWMANEGLRNGYESAIAKCFAPDSANQITTDAVQIFGGYGYIKEFPVEKHTRDAKLLQIYEGMSEIQRLVISRWRLK